MRNLKKYLSAVLLSLAMLPAFAQGQAGREWFAGVRGGMPFGASTFSSFGADKTHVGYSAGLYGGYRFNRILSLEATAGWGEVNLSAKQCCIDHDFWLGSDGGRYNVPVLGMDSWDYGNLKSDVFMQHYGLQLNLNVLGFFNATRHSRWTLEVSPLLAAVGTKATVSAISDGAEAVKGKTQWHLGAGGNIQAGYKVTKTISIGLFTGLTHLTGKGIDCIPGYIHSSNYIWESGIRIAITLRKEE